MQGLAAQPGIVRVRATWSIDPQRLSSSGLPLAAPRLRFGRCLLLASAVVVLLVAGLLALALSTLDRAPAFVNRETISPAIVDQAARQLKPLGMNALLFGGPTQEQAVVLPAASVDALVADLAVRTLGAAGSQVRFAQGSAELGLRLPVEVTALRRWVPAGRWLNLRATLVAQPKGLPLWRAVQVGWLRLPVSQTVLHWALERGVANRRIQQARQALQGVEQLGLQPQGLQVHFQSPQAMLERFRRQVLAGVDVQRLLLHQRYLQQSFVRPELPERGDLALSALLGPQLLFAVDQAMLGPSAGQAARLSQEYRVAVLAVSLQAMGVPLARLAPEISWPAVPHRPVALRGRQDHALHYLLSAALTLGADTALADTLGLYKELADAGDRKGSGFSFDDIAADKAGVALGRLALQEPLHLARRLPLMAGDDFLMPAVEGLPTALTAAQFEARFGQVGSATYNTVMAEVARRVAEVGLLK